MTFGPPNTPGSYLIQNIRWSKDYETFLTQITKAYSDIARAINTRDIAIYDLNQNVNGQEWFNPANVQLKRDGFRQVYTFTGVGNIAHLIANLTLVNGFGEYTDGTNFYGVIYASSVPIAGQVTFYVTPTNIVVQAGAGAPAISSGTIVLNFLQN